VIGWRGEPGVSDEPQHVKQGPATPPLLSCLDIPHVVLANDPEESASQVKQAFAYMTEHGTPYALLVSKGTFDTYEQNNTVSEGSMTREEALEAVLDSMKDAVFVGTTGKLSREVFELREKRGEGHDQDFLTVGSMGHASQIALGIAEAKPNKTIVCLDGDGAALMHLGGMATIGSRAPKNLIHFIFNNGVHESVGGQSVTGKDADYCAIAKALGYQHTARVDTLAALTAIKKKEGPLLIDCVITPGSRTDLGRPTTTPKENKTKFQAFLKD